MFMPLTHFVLLSLLYPNPQFFDKADTTFADSGKI